MTSLVFDLETSGLPIRNSSKYYHPRKFKYYDNSRVIEIAYNIIDEDGNIISEYNSLIIPEGFDITNSEFHGLTTEECKKDGKYIKNVLLHIENDMLKYGVVRVISHNIGFDLNILLSECYRCNSTLIKKLLSCKKVCTMLEGQEYMKVGKWPRLEELYKFLFKEDINQEHRAKSDVDYCTKCYIKMLK